MTTKQVTKTISNDYWIYPDLSTPFVVGLYYGFTPVAPFQPSKNKSKVLKDTSKHHQPGPHVAVDDIFSIFENHFEKNIPQLPLMLVRTRHKSERKGRNIVEYCFDIVGTTRSIADATLITTLYATATEEEYENVLIHINSIGDRDSFNRFNRELGVYFKKHASELHPDCKQALKKSPLDVLECTHEKCAPVKEAAPHPMNYLSEPSRTHFKEVLEFLEMSEIPFTIDNNLIENPEYGSHTMFVLTGNEKNGKDQVVLARGMRWSGIAKKLGMKKDITGISGSMCITASQEKVKRIKKPQCYLIQMGQEAKLRSLHIIDILRKAHIPVYHSLTKDKFAAQLASAENLKVPYMLIIGQKESIEHTVLVREVTHRSQDTIRIEHIAEHLKKLLK